MQETQFCDNACHVHEMLRLEDVGIPAKYRNALKALVAAMTEWMTGARWAQAASGAGEGLCTSVSASASRSRSSGLVR